MRSSLVLIFCAACFLTAPAQAEPAISLESQMKELAQTVEQLRITVARQQQEIAFLKGSRESAPPPRWNPDIGVVADTTVKLDSSKEDAEGADRLSVRELELVFGSAVDPYSRLDATIAFSDFEEASLEEAVYTHFGLPLGVTARIGRFKPRVGKAIPAHRDSLDTVDEPLVIQRYFGLEGYNKSGADILKALDIPLASTHEVSLGVLEGGNGEGGTLFGETRRRPTVYVHLKNYFDLNDVAGLELGVSHLAGSRDEDPAFEVNVTGLDGTLIWRYADQRHFKLQGEVFLNDVDDDGNPWGSYVLADLRFHPQWAAGFRFDHVELVDAVADPNSADVGYVGYLTFYQSEFVRWRLQFNHINLTDGEDDAQFWIQGTFAIGNH